MTLPTVPDPAVEPIPRHIAIVMDGNGRWARAQGLPRIRGHEKGAESVRAVLNACRDVGVKYLTLYAFSVENWVRPKKEIEGLKRLLLRFLKQNEKELHENQVRLRVIGRLSDFGGKVQAEMERVMATTRENPGSQLVLALSYGGRAEIAHAARRIAEDVRAGVLAPEAVDEAAVAARLYAPDIPDPDLMIRTSGEMRISNFLLWQISYAELYVTDVMWPEFRAPDLYEAIRAYGRRKRRFGGIEC